MWKRAGDLILKVKSKSLSKKAALESKKDFCDTTKNFPFSGLPGTSENFLLGPKYEFLLR